MLQIDFLCELLKKCKENGIHTAVDTAGNVPWKYFEFIIPYTDMFLFDVKCISENLHIAGTGASNRLIIENLTTLSSVFKGGIFIRIPVIGSFNDTKEEMNKIKEFLNNINFDKIELLPYHNMGNNKYTALNRVLPDYIVPDKNKMDKFQKIFGI